MMMPGRGYQAKTGYRYGFNGKENDNEVKNIEGSQQDYGMRMYDPRLGKFLSVDPLTKDYPELTPYQFGSNTPIQGTDLDGLEVYYAADGSLLGKIGTSTQVRRASTENIEKTKIYITWFNNTKLPEMKTYTTERANALTTSVGMSNEELNTRAMMSTLKQTENNAEGPLSYSAWNGYNKKGVQTFTDKSYSESPKEYEDHPGPNPNHGNRAAAGAYQIMRSTWKEDRRTRGYEKKYGVVDFGPNSQDKFIIAQFKDKLHALDDIKAGNLDAALTKLRTEWRSLPGPQTQFKALSIESVKQMFKKNIANELSNQSNISLPRGTTLNGF